MKKKTICIGIIILLMMIIASSGNVLADDHGNDFHTATGLDHTDGSLYSGNIEDEKTCEFTIQHPCYINISVSGGFGLTTTIENTGPQDLTNITMDIGLEGGLIFIGRNTSKTFDILSGEEISFKTIVIGLGKVDINIKVDCAELSTSATVFLFFILGIKESIL